MSTGCNWSACFTSVWTSSCVSPPSWTGAQMKQTDSYCKVFILNGGLKEEILSVSFYYCLMLWVQCLHCNAMKKAYLISSSFKFQEFIVMCTPITFSSCWQWNARVTDSLLAMLKILHKQNNMTRNKCRIEYQKYIYIYIHTVYIKYIYIHWKKSSANMVRCRVKGIMADWSSLWALWPGGWNCLWAWWCWPGCCGTVSQAAAGRTVYGRGDSGL